MCEISTPGYSSSIARKYSKCLPITNQENKSQNSHGRKHRAIAKRIPFMYLQVLCSRLTPPHWNLLWTCFQDSRLGHSSLCPPLLISCTLLISCFILEAPRAQNSNHLSVACTFSTNPIMISLDLKTLSSICTLTIPIFISRLDLCPKAQTP